MKSYEAMGLCIGRDADLVADVLGKSSILMRKWKQDPLGSGTPNPIDTLEQAMQTSLDLGRPRAEALAPLSYLNQRFAPPVVVDSMASIHTVFADIQLEQSHLTAEYSVAIRDGKITPVERRRMQREASHLRERMEEFDRLLMTTAEAE